MSNMRKLLNSRWGIENKEKCETVGNEKTLKLADHEIYIKNKDKCETVESGFEFDGWKVERQNFLNSPKEIISTFEELFNECEEQFRVLPDFGITTIKRLDDLVIDEAGGVCIFHPLVKDQSDNWKLEPHAHYIDF